MSSLRASCAEDLGDGVYSACPADVAYVVVVAPYGDFFRLGGGGPLQIDAQPRMDGDLDDGLGLVRDVCDDASVLADVVRRECEAVGEACSAQAFEHEDALGVLGCTGAWRELVDAPYLVVGERYGLRRDFLCAQDCPEIE